MASAIAHHSGKKGSAERSQSLCDLATPCFLLYQDRLRENCAAMVQRARDLRVKLRPHVKTHKTIEAHHILQEAGSGLVDGCVASTMSEVEFFAKHGQSDITLGIPFLPHHLPRLVVLKQQCPDTTVRIFLDSIEGLQLLEASLQEKTEAQSALCPMSVFIKVDCGYHRAGVDPQADPEGALQLAKAIAEGPFTQLFGLYAHSGNAYNTASGRSGAEAVASQEASRISAFADALAAAGMAVQAVSVGSTPSCVALQSLPPAVTEMHPGNFLFFDLQQVDSGACSAADVAVAVLSRVVGVYPLRNEILIDAGGTAMHKDPGGVQGWGDVEGHSDLRLLRMSQECTVVGVREGVQGGSPLAQRFKVGDLLRITPNHSCMTACQHERYHVLARHGDEEVAEQWVPCKYW